MWSGGWAQTAGGFDYSGASVVHISGGAAGFMAALIIGPRKHEKDGKKGGSKMASPINVILGTLLFWLGCVGVNCGSTIRLNNSKLHRTIHSK